MRSPPAAPARSGPVVRAGAWPRRALPAVVALFAAWAVALPTHGIDWAAAGAERVVEIVTRNADGTSRETKIWLAVVDGQGYIRTGGTRWYGNLSRDPDVVLRVAGAEHLLRAEGVTDAQLVARVEAALRAKYGWSDRLIAPFRFGETRILRLVPR